MATLKTNTLTGTSTAGSIAVTGEGNSTTTNLQQGLCKAWCDYNGNTAAITDNFNIGGITDNGTGDYTFAYTNAMASINYVFLGDAQYEDGAIGSTTMLNPKSGDANNRGASSVRVECKSMSTSSGPSNYDYKQQQFLVQGDLA